MLRFKDILVVAGLLIISQFGFTQIYDPVDWKLSVENLKDGRATVVIKADIEAHWHIYAQKLSDDPDAFGPIPTAFSFSPSPNFKAIGAVKEGKPITKWDPMFEMDLSYFENSAEFRQEIEILSDKSFDVELTVSFMACDDSKCTPPIDEVYKVRVKQETEPAEEEVGVAEESVPALQDAGTANGGIYRPVTWKAGAVNNGDNGYTVTLTANMEEGWHVYSQVLASDEGPLPTVFTFAPREGIEYLGKVEQGTPKKEYDPNFMMDLEYFEGVADFRQMLKVVSGEPGMILCNVEFMCCNEERCLPPELVEFEINLQTGVGRNLSMDTGTAEPIKEGLIPNLEKLDLQNPKSGCGEVTEATDIWTVFIFGFIGGLIALLTPCVFPMIPLTVSFFTKGGKDKKSGLARAALYGFFIFVIYALLSIPFHLGTDPAALNEISTSIPLNIAFFVIFVVFAISFFGYFEITLPNSVVNKVDNASNVGGILGIFFMALTLALVSFSCTGPILGTVLGNSLKNGPWPVTAAMSGFGVALGLPFALFAAFPQWLHSLPKSGGWLNSVKVVLGFIELALAVKFLSNADLVKQWHLIERETFFLIWTILSLATAFYLFGVIRFPHDSPLAKLKPTRMAIASLFLAFAIYLAPGIFKGSPWSHDLLSGFPPPTFYSWYEDAGKHDTFHPEFDDFYVAQQKALETGKPLLIDFTGWACVNCRKMEETVWKKPEIRSILENDFIVVSLYVDDKVELPVEDQGVLPFEVNGERFQKKIKTIGNKWAAFQTQSFANNSQPYYVMLHPDGTLLGNPVGYTPDVEEYKSYLECGLGAFRELARSASR